MKKSSLFISSMMTLIVMLSGCTSTHTIGNMQMDCVNGGWHPSACVVTASLGGKPQFQQVVSEAGASKAVIGGVTTIGAAALLGPAGIAKAGSRTTNNNSNSPSSSSNAMSHGGKGGSAYAEGGAGGSGGKGGSAYSYSDADASSKASSNIDVDVTSTNNGGGSSHGHGHDD